MSGIERVGAQGCCSLHRGIHGKDGIFLKWGKERNKSWVGIGRRGRGRGRGTAGGLAA
jgi:hypothetical protein